MFKRNTVLIFGAGTNYNSGFYLGSQLIKNIGNDFIKDIKHVLSTSDPVNTNRNRLLEDSNKLRTVINANLHDNIDHLLALHEELEEIGKLGIAYQIIKGERVSKDHNKILLYEKIFQKIVSTIKTPKDIQNIFANKLTIITFNYDRSFEFFLKNSVEKFISSNIRKFEYDEIFQSIIKIFHVYGSLGTLDEKGKQFLPYGCEINFQNIKKASENIEVIYGSKQNKHQFEIQSAINNADSIFFLGFGFDMHNLDKLQIINGLKDGCLVCGTGIGLDNDVVQRVNSLFVKYKVADNIETIIPVFGCDDFFNMYVNKYSN